MKVNGEWTDPDRPFTSGDRAAPEDAYAQSKYGAEYGLLEISAQTGMEAVILRPLLVYGPGVGANFLRLMQAVDSGLPLPLGASRNQRSLIYLGNLVDAISVCLAHPAATNKVYLVNDSEDVSTPELARRIAAALGRPARLLPVPGSWMRLTGRLLGKDAAVERLLGSLAVDSMPIREELGWSPALHHAGRAGSHGGVVPQGSGETESNKGYKVGNFPHLSAPTP